MFKCPQCNSTRTAVKDTRWSDFGIRRRRECLNCNKRFTTREHPEQCKGSTGEKMVRVPVETYLMLQRAALLLDRINAVIAEGAFVHKPAAKKQRQRVASAFRMLKSATEKEKQEKISEGAPHEPATGG